MELVTAEQRRQLIDNWNLVGDALWPVVKIFSPVGSATWIIAAMTPRTKTPCTDYATSGSATPSWATCG